MFFLFLALAHAQNDIYGNIFLQKSNFTLDFL